MLTTSQGWAEQNRVVLLLLFCLLWYRALLFSLGWPRTYYPPASSSWLLQCMIHHGDTTLFLSIIMMFCQNKRGHAMEANINIPVSWPLYSGGCPVFSDYSLHPSAVTLVFTGLTLEPLPPDVPFWAEVLCCRACKGQQLLIPEIACLPCQSSLQSKVGFPPRFSCPPSFHAPVSQQQYLLNKADCGAWICVAPYWCTLHDKWPWLLPPPSPMTPGC